MKKRGSRKRRHKHTLTGTLSKHRKGFGFVAWKEGEKEIYINSKYMGSAMDGDTVSVQLLPAPTWKGTSGIRIDGNYRPARPEGRITAVKKRKLTAAAGTFVMPGSYVIPAGKSFPEEIFIADSSVSGVQSGDRVMVKLTRYPDRYKRAEGRIVEIISRRGEPGGDIRLIARSFGMKEPFSAEARIEAKELRNEYYAQAEQGYAYCDTGGHACGREIRKRRDLRNETIFTIDGDDARDFDDAVSIGLLENGNYLLGVHIADVSHFVAENSALDSEALERGTSVYLLDQVIPMLPRELSDDLCSLKPGQDKLTISLDIELTGDGTVVAHEIYESIICSKARLVYDDVSDMLEGDTQRQERGMAGGKGIIIGDYAEIENALFMMRDLAEALERKKEERGSVDFDVEETAIILDENGAPVSIGIRDRRTANRMIEEFMLLANETIAAHFRWLEAPFIYRVHEKPEAEKIERLRVFLQSFGIPFRSSSDKVHPKTLSNILHSIKGSPFEHVINTVTLRSMQKAYYSTSCDGHFGLALDHYCHFTSPIRRYPDLMIHRVIKSVINDGPAGKSFKHYASLVQEAAERSSAAERRAIEAEREVEKLKKAEYMSSQTGQLFDGIISGVAGFGFFVELNNTIEGLVRIEELFDDEYQYIPELYMLQGIRTGRQYRLGDRVVIAVESVDIGRREINFCLT